MHEAGRKALYDEAMEIRRRYEELRQKSDAASLQERERLKARYTELARVLAASRGDVAEAGASGPAAARVDSGPPAGAATVGDGATQVERLDATTTEAVDTQRSAPSEITDAGATVAEGAGSAVEAAERPEDSVAAEWAPGEVILDEYEVKDVLGEGGMGKVYRVHHRGWDLDMAVKCPKPDLFRTPAQKETFVTECHTWMDLGLHPHIVTCYYVRVLGGIPRVFAECAEGGGLRDWIDDGRLYEGGHEKALERILDVSIQFARALHYAHEKGLIHQDVKPANVLMTPKGEVKLTDFGLANAQASLEESGPAPAGLSMLASYGGMTPAYCSPEQAENAARRQAGMAHDKLDKLTRRTDLYSWAVSIFEMFNGGVTWEAGNVASHALDSYLEHGPAENDLPPMPEAVAALLRHCLAQDPEQRPNGMDELTTSLEALYQETTGRAYPREAPVAPTELADVLNNKALSFLELGNAVRAEALWREALKSDLHHTEATFNLVLAEWRAGKVSDTEAVRRMEEIRASHEREWRDEYLLALIHLERGDGEAALRALDVLPKEANEGRSVAEAWRQARRLGPSCLRIFQGHTREINSVALSPDGRWALSGSGDPTLRLWDSQTGQCLRTLEGHTANVLTVTFSPNGRWALSGSSDNTFKLWDVQKRGRRCGPAFCGRGHTAPLRSVAVSPDGRWALSGSSDNTLKLWEVETGQYVRTFEGHIEMVHSVAISPDGRWALSGSSDSTLKLWDVETGQCLRTLQGHTLSVASVAFSPDGQWVLSGGEDWAVRLWNVETGQCLRTLQGHTLSVASVAFSPDGRWALSGSSDKTLKLWEVETGRCLRTFQGHAAGVSSVAFSADGRSVLSGSLDRTLRMWEVPSTGAAPRAISRIASSADALASERLVGRMARDAREALAKGHCREAYDIVGRALSVPGYARFPSVIELKRMAGRGGRTRGLSQAWLSKTFQGHADVVNSVGFSPDARWALSGSGRGRLRWEGIARGDNSLKLWDVQTGQSLRTFQGHTAAVLSVAFSPDGQRALSGGEDDTLKLWDMQTGQCLRTFEGRMRGVNSVAFSPDGLRALSGSSDKTLKLWDVQTGQCLWSSQGHTAAVLSVALSPDSRWALSGNSDKTLKLWDVRTGQCLRTFRGHAAWVRSVAFSPDGRWALSGGEDDALKLWEVHTGKCLRTFEGRTLGVNSVAFSPDGRWALSGSGTSFNRSYDTVKLWEVHTGKCIRSLEGHAGQINSISFSRDSRWGLAGSDDQTLTLWELDWDYEFPDPKDWDEDAKPYLENFLTLHTPYAAALPEDRIPTAEDSAAALTRSGRPIWTDEDSKQLLDTLADAGYGWLRPEGVRKELEKMAANWTGPPPLPGIG